MLQEASLGTKQNIKKLSLCESFALAANDNVSLSSSENKFKKYLVNIYPEHEFNSYSLKDIPEKQTAPLSDILHKKMVIGGTDIPKSKYLEEHFNVSEKYWNELLANTPIETNIHSKPQAPSSWQEKPEPVMPPAVVPRVFPIDLPLYNAEQPVIIVDTAHDHPGRGDSHGYMGLAAAVAKKINGRLVALDAATLDTAYPSIKGEDKRVRYIKRLRAYFNEHGYPDFYFNAREGETVRERALDGGSGIVISQYNESLPGMLLPNYHVTDMSRCEVVPHHLTPEVLSFEGGQFAGEFAELPRPFIGVNLTSPGHESGFAEKLASIMKTYPEATVFLCGCHRTPSDQLKNLAYRLKELLGNESNYPVVSFDYKEVEEREGQSGFWNPYKGLLDQADHLVIQGSSGSMLSEALSTGKVVYKTDGTHDMLDGAVRALSRIPPGEGFVIGSIPPVNLMDECAIALINKHAMFKNSLRGNTAKPYAPLW